ncbi:MAG: tRNA (guanosine(37)-N1)-methyltransferase TrmD [Chloroflexi bacterium]|nr:tRNA (guanosine(37)-N1)-methyltransferase TrmD [Chloroflexota bacterium]MBV9544506.1 tRNA (guanosine(37)-N1)-methyltransferase TrmD [Chloroflexota bacterium]
MSHLIHFDVLTLFPHMFPGPVADSITGRALAEGVASINAIDIRAFATDRHRTVDDYPYGGGPGMVMRPGPVLAAIDSVRKPHTRLILLSPTGTLFRQPIAAELSHEQHVVLVCGRYEGIDERVALLSGAEELSIGDFVLTGGEVAAMVVLDAVIRLLPGVLASPAAWRDESHAIEGLLEYPQYTRPPEFAGVRVPDILLSGHHAQVAAWRRREALERTLARRPELLTPDQLAELEHLRRAT